MAARTFAKVPRGMADNSTTSLGFFLWIGEHIDQLEPVLKVDDNVIWYRKRVEMSHIARACGILFEFESIGEYVPHDALPDIQDILGVTDDCMRQLFIESDLPGIL